MVANLKESVGHFFHLVNCLNQTYVDFSCFAPTMLKAAIYISEGPWWRWLDDLYSAEEISFFNLLR